MRKLENNSYARQLPFPNNLICDAYGLEFIKERELPYDTETTVDYITGLLEDRACEAVRLRYKEQMTFVEIAEVFGVSSERARQIINKVLVFFRKEKNLEIIKVGIHEYVSTLECTAQNDREEITRLRQEAEKQEMYFKLPVSSDLESIDIGVCRFSLRTHNTLKRGGINSVAQLLEKYEKNELIKIRNFGKSSSGEVEDYIIRNGLKRI